MADYGKVFRRIWSSPDFMAASEDARAMTLYLLTSEHGTSEGMFRLPIAYASNDLRWPFDRASNALAELVETGFIGYDEQVGIVLVVKALRWNSPKSPNNVKGAASAVAELRDTPLRQLFLDQCDQYCPALATELTSNNGWVRCEIPPEDAPDQRDSSEGSSKGLRTPSEPGPHSPTPTPTPTPIDQPLLSSSQANPTRADEIAEVFGYWQERLGKQRSQLDAKRTKAIKARLVDGYTVDDLKLAVDGILLDPHKMGANDRQRKFDDIELACREAANVDALIELATNGNTAPARRSSDRRSRIADNGDAWVAEMDNAIGVFDAPEMMEIES